MKKISFYSKTSIFLFSILLTGVLGAFMLGYNLRKAGKKRYVFPLVVITLFANILLLLIIRSLYKPVHWRQWSLNKAQGVGWDIYDYLWWMGDIYQFFLPNIIIGFLLVNPVWKKQLSQFPTYEHKAPWIPLAFAVVLYSTLLIFYS